MMRSGFFLVIMNLTKLMILIRMTKFLQFSIGIKQMFKFVLKQIFLKHIQSFLMSIFFQDLQRKSSFHFTDHVITPGFHLFHSLLNYMRTSMGNITTNCNQVQVIYWQNTFQRVMI